MRKWNHDVSGRHSWLLDQADYARSEAERQRREGELKRAELWDYQAAKYEQEAAEHAAAQEIA